MPSRAERLQCLRRWQRLLRRVRSFLHLMRLHVSLEYIWQMLPSTFNLLNDQSRSLMDSEVKIHRGLTKEMLSQVVKEEKFPLKPENCRHVDSRLVKESNTRWGKFKECLQCGSRWILCEPKTPQATWAPVPTRASPGGKAGTTPKDLLARARPSGTSSSSSAACSATSATGKSKEKDGRNSYKDSKKPDLDAHTALATLMETAKVIQDYAGRLPTPEETERPRKATCATRAEAEADNAEKDVTMVHSAFDDVATVDSLSLPSEPEL